MPSLRRIGEFGLIERIKKTVPPDASVVRGIGDDCAVVRFNKTHYLLLTSDMIVEGVDFTRRAPPELVGRKAVAVSLSDIAACAGTPRYCLISVAFPPKTTLSYVERMHKGMRDICRTYHTTIVGGDLSRSRQLMIQTTVVGVVRKDRLLLRCGAQAGDLIFVSGPLGGSLKGKHLRFCPRLKEAAVLAANFPVHAMIDISDGLVQDLGHILTESKKGAVLFEELIPLSRQARRLTDALYDGEDFELLFTLRPAFARRLLAHNRFGCRLVGEIVTSPGIQLIRRSGRQETLRPHGYRHF